MGQIQEEVLSSLSEAPRVQANGSVSGRFCFKKEFIGFSGHFPEYPLLPAFIQIICAQLLIHQVYPDTLILMSVEKAKFLAEIHPDDDITIDCMPAPGLTRLEWKVKIRSGILLAASFVMTFKEKGVNQ